MHFRYICRYSLVGMKKKKSKDREDPNGGSYRITKLGSIGLLAMGYKGLREWRKVRDAEQEKSRNEK